MLVKVFIDAIRVLFRERLPKFAFVVAVMSAAFFLFEMFMPPIQGSTLLVLVYALIQVMLTTVLAVTVHRIVLLDEGLSLRWGWRETRFAVRFVGLGVVTSALVALLVLSATSMGFPSSGYVFGTFAFVVVLIVTWWMSQFFLILPAVAVDHSYKLKKSSVYTEENRVTTFFVVILFPIIFSLLTLPAAAFENTVAATLASNILSVLSVSLGIAALSRLYRELVPKSAWGRSGF